jgi:hypothetical protein
MRVETVNGKEFAILSPEDFRKCGMCGVNAVVPLTPGQLASQPDSTTHVCHPALGGCNHGFELTENVLMFPKEE